MRRIVFGFLVGIMACIALSPIALAKGGSGGTWERQIANKEAAGLPPWSLPVAVVLGFAALLFVSWRIRAGEPDPSIILLAFLVGLIGIIFLGGSLWWAVTDDPRKAGAMLLVGVRYGVFVLAGSVIGFLVTPVPKQIGDSNW